MNRMAGCQMEVTAKLCSAASRAWLPGSPAAWMKPGTGWNWMELDGCMIVTCIMGQAGGIGFSMF